MLRRGRCCALCGGLLVGPLLRSHGNCPTLILLIQSPLPGDGWNKFISLMKKLYLNILLLLLSGFSSAQVPNYVPTNGLVGWWPFNGNANDESGNGYNGTVNGALLSTDRFNQNNKAYSFGGNQQGIIINQNIFNVGSGNISFSISLWLLSDLNNNSTGEVINNRVDAGGTNYNYRFNLNNNLNQPSYRMLSFINPNIAQSNSAPNILVNQVWNHIVLIGDISQNQMRIYRDGILIATSSNILSPNLSNPTKIGYMSNLDPSFKGKIDDIGIWNRSLTQQEITTLYQGCNINVNVNPTTANVAIGTNANLVASGGTSYQWQTNPANNGWQNVNNNSTYTGATTATLGVNNIQLQNHQQQFRVISASGNCADTAYALINVTDTCINNITTSISVTDTLVINAVITGVNPPNNINTISIYPNPANTHITIDNGNFALMIGYTVRINNALGQTVFSQTVNQQQFYIDLSGWTGNGYYYLDLIDNLGNTIENKVIVIQ